MGFKNAQEIDIRLAQYNPCKDKLIEHIEPARQSGCCYSHDRPVKASLELILCRILAAIGTIQRKRGRTRREGMT